MRKVRPAKPQAVMGIDLSLRGPAAIVLKGVWDPTEPFLRTAWQDGVFEDEGMRVVELMGRIARTVKGLAWEFGVTHAYIEGYAHNMGKMSSASKLRELGGVVKHLLWEHLSIEPVPVPEMSARKLLLGKLPPRDRKVYVQEKVYGMGAPKTWTDNLVDAFVVANYGRHALGLPCLAAGG